MTQTLTKKITLYHVIVLLSTFSMLLGILREFLLVGLFGFTATNDYLQLYLSIFYTVGLSIDAMRLSCLNLYTALPLSRLLAVASLISLPFILIIAILMIQTTQSLDISLFIVTLFGCYLNLMAALLITYKQRSQRVISAQLINILPNFVLIPGILIAYLNASHHIIFILVALTSFIPLLQCLFLLSLKHEPPTLASPTPSFRSAVMVFLRHFSTVSSEQLFQILTRAAFYRFGTGYLTLYAITVRIYSAARFILVDSLIGTKLSEWNKALAADDFLYKLMRMHYLGIILVAITLLLSLVNHIDFMSVSIQMSLIFIVGFYFSTLVRIGYFKANCLENNPQLILRYTACEIMSVLFLIVWMQKLEYPIMVLLWIGYIVKPFSQLLLLRKHMASLHKKMES